MYRVSFYLPALRKLHFISTPSEAAALAIGVALRRQGYAARVWDKAGHLAR